MRASERSQCVGRATPVPVVGWAPQTGARLACGWRAAGVLKSGATLAVERRNNKQTKPTTSNCSNSLMMHCTHENTTTSAGFRQERRRVCVCVCVCLYVLYRLLPNAAVLLYGALCKYRSCVCVCVALRQILMRGHFKEIELSTVQGRITATTKFIYFLPNNFPNPIYFQSP